MRRTCTLILVGSVLLLGTACGSDPAPLGSSGSDSTGPAASSTAAAASPDSTSAGQRSSADVTTNSTPDPSPESDPTPQSDPPSDPTSAAGEGTSDSIPVPAELGLAVGSLPLMPGATVETTPEVAGPSTVSFQIKNEGKSGREIADWYYAAMGKAGFEVAKKQYPNGGFSYQGEMVRGDSASTTSSFIIGISKASG